MTNTHLNLITFEYLDKLDLIRQKFLAEVDDVAAACDPNNMPGDIATLISSIKTVAANLKTTTESLAKQNNAQPEPPPPVTTNPDNLLAQGKKTAARIRKLFDYINITYNVSYKEAKTLNEARDAAGACASTLGGPGIWSSVNQLIQIFNSAHPREIEDIEISGISKGEMLIIRGINKLLEKAGLDPLITP
jgi:hypothetical protein